MQVNRKYNSMILLITIMLSLALQGDSGLTNLADLSCSNKSIDIKTEINSNSIAEINNNDFAGDESGTEDTFISDSKFWIINKETILGY